MFLVKSMRLFAFVSTFSFSISSFAALSCIQFFRTDSSATADRGSLTSLLEESQRKSQARMGFLSRFTTNRRDREIVRELLDVGMRVHSQAYLYKAPSYPEQAVYLVVARLLQQGHSLSNVQIHFVGGEGTSGNARAFLSIGDKAIIIDGRVFADGAQVGPRWVDLVLHEVPLSREGIYGAQDSGRIDASQYYFRVSKGYESETHIRSLDAQTFYRVMRQGEPGLAKLEELRKQAAEAYSAEVVDRSKLDEIEKKEDIVRSQIFVFADSWMSGMLRQKAYNSKWESSRYQSHVQEFAAAIERIYPSRSLEQFFLERH